MTQSSKILFPQQIDQERHLSFLEQLRQKMKEFQEQNAFSALTEASPDFAKIRIRTWQFYQEDGVPTVDIHLDKGYENAQLNGNITFDECLGVQKAFLETDLFDIFDDRVEICFGSPGIEPILEDLCDFEAALNHKISVEFPKKEGKKQQISGILIEISQKEGDTVIVLQKGSQNHEILRSQIHIARSLTAPKTAQGQKKTGRKNK